jgi:hypothetical protein
LTKKWGILIKKESESIIFTGLEIPRDYRIVYTYIHKSESENKVDKNISGDIIFLIPLFFDLFSEKTERITSK